MINRTSSSCWLMIITQRHHSRRKFFFAELCWPSTAIISRQYHHEKNNPISINNHEKLQHYRNDAIIGDHHHYHRINLFKNHVKTFQIFQKKTFHKTFTDSSKNNGQASTSLVPLETHYTSNSSWSDDIEIISAAIRARKQKEEMGRDFISKHRAMREYALELNDLETMKKFQRRSPFLNEQPITVYLRKDVEDRALEIWKNWTQLSEELKRRRIEEEKRRHLFDSSTIKKEDFQRNSRSDKIGAFVLNKSEGVVRAALLVNLANFGLKLITWVYTGSHSIFSETIHSFADTLNQLLLLYGLRKSIQSPNREHPYGYHRMRFIVSLISGVTIFSTGAGISFYHGLHGLLVGSEATHPPVFAYAILAGSLLSEGTTFWLAIRALKYSKSVYQPKMSLLHYSNEPTLNVVLLEDFSALVGVLIASSCMALSHYFQTSIFDACGSLIIGVVLGTMASFVIYTNGNALVEKSIAQNQIDKINKFLELDQMIRAIHDVKATQMGNDMVKYKAEVDFDGRCLSQIYLKTIEMEELVSEISTLKTNEQIQEFMIKHGENIVDLLGGEIDRIENELKMVFPMVRHVDLEVL